jgi:2-aminoadipate transaminase
VAKQAADLHTSSVTQAAAAEWLEATDMDAHLAHVRGVYRERRDALLAALPEHLPEGSAWTEPEGGMFSWVTLPEGCDAPARLDAALAAGVAYVPGVPFYAGTPDRRTLRLAFSEPPPAAIAEGVARLGRVL